MIQLYIRIINRMFTFFIAQVDRNSLSVKNISEGRKIDNFRQNCYDQIHMLESDDVEIDICYGDWICGEFLYLREKEK